MLGNTDKNGGGTTYYVKVDDQGQLVVVQGWDSSQQSDIGAGNDKSFTVPASKEWILQSIYVNYQPTGTVGTRTIVVEIQDASSNVVWKYDHSNNTTVASTDIEILFSQNFPIVSDNIEFHPCPQIEIPTGFVVRIYDSAGISAGDTCDVRMMILSRDA